VKLLLDQNISYRLVKKIESLFPGSEQVVTLGLQNKPDRLIWEFAKKEGFTILTFDSDFYELSLTQGHPPKLIWIKSGNVTTNNLLKLLSGKASQVQNFADDSELSCLEIVD
jgi:predicted nuclease of predicted toxin-antitoxin system